MLHFIHRLAPSNPRARGFEIWQENQEKSLKRCLKIKEENAKKKKIGRGLNTFWWDLINCRIAKDYIGDISADIYTFHNFIKTQYPKANGYLFL